MTQLAVIEKSGQRVLTTAQLAEAFATDVKVISNNFTRNKERYTLEKHYFVLTGEDLKAFKTIHRNDEQFKHATMVYLWTEKGAWMHAKSLNTDEAWEAYEGLVDDYYRAKQAQSNVAPLDERKVRMELLKTAVDHEERIDQVEQRVAEVERKVEEEITLDYRAQRLLQRTVSKKVYDITLDDIDRRSLFQELYREIKDRWGVASYKDVRRSELPQVLKYVDAWRPRVLVVV